jgi:hypothetical protein
MISGSAGLRLVFWRGTTTELEQLAMARGRRYESLHHADNERAAEFEKYLMPHYGPIPQTGVLRNADKAGSDHTAPIGVDTIARRRRLGAMY